MKMTETKVSGISARISDYYESNFGDGATRRVVLPTINTEEIIEIVRAGDLDSMVFLAWYSNMLDDQGDHDKADSFRAHNYGAQMRNLEWHSGSNVLLHSANFLSESVAREVKLIATYPFLSMRTDMMYIPFMELDGGVTAIQSVGDGQERTLYVNPQILNKSLVEKLKSYRISPSDPECIREFDRVLRKNYGNAPIDTTRPWLKEGRLLP